MGVQPSIGRLGGGGVWVHYRPVVLLPDLPNCTGLALVETTLYLGRGLARSTAKSSVSDRAVSLSTYWSVLGALAITAIPGESFAGGPCKPGSPGRHYLLVLAGLCA